MSSIVLKITAKEPLIISSRSVENANHEALKYIPGTALLGAFAGVAIDNGESTSGEFFRDVFLKGKVTFGHAFPSVGGKRAYPLPSSYAHAKGYAAIASSAGDSKVFDRAFILAKADDPNNREVMQEKYFDLLKELLDETDDEKTKDLKHAKHQDLGVKFVDSDSKNVSSPDIGDRTHTAIGANRRSARESFLFGYEFIATGTTFFAEITSANDELLNKLCETETLYLGRSRSAGFGKASIIKINNAPKIESSIEGSTHIIDFVNGVVMPAGVTSIEELLCGCNIVQGGFFGGYRTLQSFHGKRGLPRSDVKLLEPGSVAIVTCDDISPLAEKPLGSRTNEGYGQIVINCKSLHGSEMPKLKHWRPAIVPQSGIKRPSGKFAGLAFDRWLKKKAQNFADYLIVNKMDALIGENSEALNKDRLSNTQLAALRTSVQSEQTSEDGLKAGREYLKVTIGKSEQQKKWESVHIKDPVKDPVKDPGFMGKNIESMTNVMLALLEGNEAVEAWLSTHLKDYDKSFKKINGFSNDTRAFVITGVLSAIVRRRQAKKAGAN